MVRKFETRIGFAAALVVSNQMVSSSPTEAYPIDCAILLCLAGGFPASAECSSAKAEVIRRITPWPIEPPLQIWRCPMESTIPAQRPFVRNNSSDFTFDFVRSIKAYDIDWYAWPGATNNGDRDVCHRPRSRARIGSYDIQGDFGWDSLTPTTAPDWLGTNLAPDGPCSAAGNFRGVGVEWTDYFGNHGFEVIRY